MLSKLWTRAGAAVALAASSASGALALTPYNSTDMDGMKTQLSNAHTGNPWSPIATFINYLLGLIGIVAFFFILYGGVLILTSQGDPEKIGEARKIVVYAIAGGVVIMIAFALNNWIFGSTFWTTPTK